MKNFCNDREGLNKTREAHEVYILSWRDIDNNICIFFKRLRNNGSELLSNSDDNIYQESSLLVFIYHSTNQNMTVSVGVIFDMKSYRCWCYKVNVDSGDDCLVMWNLTRVENSLYLFDIRHGQKTQFRFIFLCCDNVLIECLNSMKVNNVKLQLNQFWSQKKLIHEIHMKFAHPQIDDSHSYSAFSYKVSHIF